MTATTLSDIKGIPALNNYRVIIADDHLMVREGLKWKLSKMNRYSVIAEAENGHDALNHALSLQCDLLLIDISMPGLTGLEVMKKVKLKKPDLRVIL
ncbi:MAG TPA: response regulator transcription factor, partial [Bacteroidales bacterium]|nr:response regulator transcription factor [Bacteroidales bacterium]